MSPLLHVQQEPCANLPSSKIYTFYRCVVSSLFTGSLAPICSKIINPTDVLYVHCCLFTRSLAPICSKIINLQMCYVPTVACSAEAVCLFAQQQDI